MITSSTVSTLVSLSACALTQLTLRGSIAAHLFFVACDKKIGRSSLGTVQIQEQRARSIEEKSGGKSRRGTADTPNGHRGTDSPRGGRPSGGGAARGDAESPRGGERTPAGGGAPGFASP